MENNQKFYGIDVSKDSLQLATQDFHGNWVDSKLSNEVSVINEWLDSLPEGEDVFVVLEYTGTYSCRLVDCLDMRGLEFCCLTSGQSSGFGKVVGNTSKTDKQDTRNLWHYGVKMRPAPTVLESESSKHKKQAFKHLSNLKSDLSAYQNRLHALGYDPRANPRVSASIEQMIGAIKEQIEAVEKEIYGDEKPDLSELEKRLQTITGIGSKSAKVIVTSTNGLSNFDNPKKLAKFLGVCPSDHQSGSSVKGRGSIVRSANGYVRSCLYMAARSASIYNIACKSLYERLRAMGKPHRVAMTAVVHKLVRQVFAIAAKNEDFVNNYAAAK